MGAIAHVFARTRICIEYSDLFAPNKLYADIVTESYWASTQYLLHWNGENVATSVHADHGAGWHQIIRLPAYTSEHMSCWE